MNKLVPLIVAWALTAVASSAVAQVYKCKLEGRVIYQQMQCVGGETVNMSGAGKADPGAERRLEKLRERAEQERSAKREEAIVVREILPGKTRE